MKRTGTLNFEDGIEAVGIPPIPENTVKFAAGAVTFGVEYRFLTPERAKGHLVKNAAAGMETVDFDMLGIVDGQGVSIHVFATSDDREFLRFDCFDTDPHYHYMDPERPWINRYAFDTRANGSMLDWIFDRLGSRLTDMLGVSAAGRRLAGQIDGETVRRVLGEVERCAREATVQQRAALGTTQGAAAAH